MKKLKLDMDALRVESFASDAAGEGRGTVHGHLRPTDPKVCPFSNNWYCSVGDGCTWEDYTCRLSCGGDPCISGHQTCPEFCA